MHKLVYMYIYTQARYILLSITYVYTICMCQYGEEQMRISHLHAVLLKANFVAAPHARINAKAIHYKRNENQSRCTRHLMGSNQANSTPTMLPLKLHIKLSHGTCGFPDLGIACSLGEVRTQRWSHRRICCIVKRTRCDHRFPSQCENKRLLSGRPHSPLEMACRL